MVKLSRVELFVFLALLWLIGSIAAAATLYFLLLESQRPNTLGFAPAVMAVLVVALCWLVGVVLLRSQTLARASSLRGWTLSFFLGAIVVWLIFEATIV